MNRELHETIITQFILVAELQLKSNKKIQEFIDEHKSKSFSNELFEYSPEASFLRLVANDAYFEAVNNMNMLLFPIEHEKECSLADYIEKYHGETVVKKQFEEIQEKYKNDGFLKIRHNITAHKSSKHFNFEVGRMLPVDHLYLGINPKQVENLLSIINAITDYFPDWLKDIYENFTPREGGRPYQQQEIGLDFILDSIRIKYGL